MIFVDRDASGNISAIYFAQQILVLVGARNAFASNVWLLAVYVAIVLVVATASYHYLEVPTRKWIVGRFFPNGAAGREALAGPPPRLNKSL